MLKFVKRHVKSILFAVFAISLCLFFGWAKTINMSLGSGALVQIRPASFLGSLLGAECSIALMNERNVSARVSLQQTFWKSPIIVIPSTNSDVFLCLYDNDVDLQLLRIEPTRGFKALPSNRPLSRIVLASSCQVEEADGGDLAFAMERLKQMPLDEFKRFSIPNFNFGIFSIYDDPDDEVALLAKSDEMMYEGDVAYPDPHQKGRWVKHPMP